MFRRLLFVALALVSAGPLACRDKEPPPSHYVDLGSEGQPLPPPAATWKDARLLPGTADWHPFREPALKAEATAAGGAPGEPVKEAGANPEVEGEVRTALTEYAEKLGSEAVAEISDFYESKQAEVVTKLVPALQTLSAKLKDLAAAMPDAKEKLERAAELLAPSAILKLEPADIHVKGAKDATVKLAAVPEIGFLPEVDAGQVKPEISINLGEDGYWYIQSPVIEALAKILPALESSAAQLDGIIADAKAGTATVAVLAERSPIVEHMIESLGAENEEAPAEAEEPEEEEPEGEQ